MRFITATNRDLAREACAGRFRGDLYSRVNGLLLRTPALRQLRSSLRAALALFALTGGCASASLQVPSATPSKASTQSLARGVTPTPTPASTPPPREPLVCFSVMPHDLLGRLRLLPDGGSGEPAFAAFVSVPGLRWNAPMLFAVDNLDGRGMVIVASLDRTAALGESKPQPLFEAAGLLSVEQGRCALLRQDGSDSLLFCGAAPDVVATSKALTRRYAELRSQAEPLRLTFSVNASASARRALALRSAVPPAIDDWFGPTELGDDARVMGLLSELGFDYAARAAEAVSRSGAVQAWLSFGPNEQAALEFEAPLSSDSELGRVLLRARMGPTPTLLWDLPYAVDSAIAGQSELLFDLFAPGARAKRLLAELERAGSAGVALFAKLAALEPACNAPGRGWVLANGHAILPASASASASGSAPTSAPASSTSGANVAYTLFGFSDEKSACFRAVLAGARSLVESAHGGRARITPLPIPKKTKPALDFAFELQQDAGRSLVVTFAHAKASGWLAWGSDLESLSGPLYAVLNPDDRKLKRTAERPELAPLRNGDAIAAVFLADTAPTNARSGDPHASGAATRRALKIERAAATLRATSAVPLAELRQTAAKYLGLPLASTQLSGLEAKRLAGLSELLEATCRAGSNEACNALGLFYLEGKSERQDATLSADLFGVACAREHGISCLNLGFQIRDSEPSRSHELYRKACELGSMNGCAWYGITLAASSAPEDQKHAVLELRKACEAELGYACLHLGNAYSQGQGVVEDVGLAADHYEHSCRLDVGVGCVAFGNLLVAGRGRAQDSQAGFKFYERACTLSTTFGCYALGMAYLEGTGTIKNRDGARRALVTACDAGHAEACRMLAVMQEGQP